MRSNCSACCVSSSAQGKEGVHLRKSKFELIEDGFVQNSGLKQLSYQASGRTAITGEGSIRASGWRQRFERPVALGHRAAVQPGLGAHCDYR